MGTSHQVTKASFKGDKCPIYGIQYILLALVYLGDYDSFIFLMCRRGSDYLRKNMTITLYAEKIL
jgi:hypothetical protein